MKKSRDYFYMSLENGKFIYYLFTSTHRAKTFDNWLDAYNQITKVNPEFNSPNFERFADNTLLDTPKNRDEQLFDEYPVIDCREA